MKTILSFTFAISVSVSTTQDAWGSQQQNRWLRNAQVSLSAKRALRIYTQFERIPDIPIPTKSQTSPKLPAATVAAPSSAQSSSSLATALSSSSSSSSSSSPYVAPSPERRELTPFGLVMQRILVFFPDELIKLVRDYGWETAKEITMKGFCSQIIDILPLSGPANLFADIYLIMPHKNRVDSIFNCVTEQELFHQERKAIQRLNKEHEAVSIDKKNQTIIDTIMQQNIGINCTLELPGNFLVTGHANGLLSVWELTNQKYLLIKQINAHSSPVTTLALLASGFLVSGSESEGPLKIWNITTACCVATLPGIQLELPTIIQETNGSLTIATVSRWSAVNQLIPLFNGSLVAIFNESDCEKNWQVMKFFV